MELSRNIVWIKRKEDTQALSLKSGESFKLNDSFTFIIEQLKQEKQVDQIINSFAEKYELNPPEAETAVKEALNKLKEMRLLD